MRRGAALALGLLTACAAEGPTDPTGEVPPPGGALPALTGATSTPIFPTATAGSVQARGDARGLNASGQITGAVYGLSTGIDDFRSYRWTPGSGAEMITGCCGTEWGADINDAGVVTGTTQQSLTIGSRGFVAAGTTLDTLPILPGADGDLNAGAVAINNAGLIVGYSPSGNGSPARHAVVWNAARNVHDIGTLGGTNSTAIDVNASGAVIGSSQIAGDAATHFFLWKSGAGMIDLNTIITPTITSVVEINDAGQITGTFTTTSGASHAFLYTPGAALRDLGTLGGSTTTPTGLNNAGQVVGSSTTADGATHAFLWTPSKGISDITALTGITNVGRLNAKLQTVSGYGAPAGSPDLAYATVPRLVQLDF